jgi:hypothetical protein
MSPAATITTADDFSAPDGESNEAASSNSNLPIRSTDECGAAAATAVLAVALSVSCGTTAINGGL